MGFWKGRVYLCVDCLFGIFRRLVFSSVVLRYGCVHRRLHIFEDRDEDPCLREAGMKIPVRRKHTEKRGFIFHIRDSGR